MPTPNVVLALCLLAPIPVVADQHPSPLNDAPSDEVTSNEGGAIEVVEVHAHPLSGEGLSQAAVTLDGDNLERNLGASIGATVGRQPGVQSASFGAAVGRPVIHGMSGARVRIMEDRIDTMDASVTSPDHANSVEPFIANRVEVLKGPSTLLYGAGAIGGVVDVHTGRIPHSAPDSVSGKAELRAADNAGQGNLAVRLDGGGGLVGWHMDAFARSADAYDIPGFSESARVRAAEDQEDQDDHVDPEEHADEEAAFGQLPGSHVAGKGGAFGMSLVGDWGFAGAAVSTLRYDYGLPGGHGHHEEEDHSEDSMHGDDEAGHGAEEGNVTLDLEQTRIDFEAGFPDPFASLSSLNVRFGINDYAHAEIEPNGEVGTLFANNAFEARIELADQDHAGIDGAAGVQFGNREFSAIGEEAFVPPVQTASIGVFWVAERTFENFDLEAGARLDRTGHDPSGRQGTDFTTLSVSLGLVAPIGDALLGVHGDYSSRAPLAEELYSDGPHLASMSFELGNPNLDPETAVNAAATVSWQGEHLKLSATAYATAFRDHIYQFATGAIEDDLRVMRYGQVDAVYRGVDVEASAHIARFDGGDLSARVMFDTVVAELDLPGNDKLPRLPPSRFGAGLEFDRGRFAVSVDYLHVLEQDEPADVELPTDGYDDLRMFVRFDLDVDGNTRLFLQGRNLTDNEQRQHTSYIKDFAPMPGRTLEAGVRLTF